MSGGILALILIPVGLGALVFGIIMLKRHSKFFKSNEKKPDEKQIVKEELDRVLEDVTDEDTKKAMLDFEKNQTQNDKKEENK